MAEYIIELPDKLPLKEAPPLQYTGKLVRCKDCKYWIKDEGYCKDTELYISIGDWFCADGVKCHEEKD